MDYFISDPHLDHANIIKLNNRPFKDVSEMNSTIINNWNRKVKPEDHVYIVGDFLYKSSTPASEFLKQLNGQKHLIIGNHDKQIKYDSECKKYFKSIDSMLTIYINNTPVVLCHYPMLEWDGMYKGAYHIYGHIHNNTKDTPEFESTYKIMKKYRPKALNAAVDINNFEPVTFNELIKNNEIFNKTH